MGYFLYQGFSLPLTECFIVVINKKLKLDGPSGWFDFQFTISSGLYLTVIIQVLSLCVGFIFQAGFSCGREMAAASSLAALALPSSKGSPDYHSDYFSLGHMLTKNQLLQPKVCLVLIGLGQSISEPIIMTRSYGCTNQGETGSRP